MGILLTDLFVFDKFKIKRFLVGVDASPKEKKIGDFGESGLPITECILEGRKSAK